MRDGLYRPDPLSSEEREEYETNLIAFCDRELDRLGDISGLEVLYAGGASPLWLEGLSLRIGGNGRLTTLELDPDRVEGASDALRDAELAAPVRLVAGDVFEPPFDEASFDLVYSSGLLHELDVRRRSVAEALDAMTRAVRPGGRVAASDFVASDEAPAAVQIEDERQDRERARLDTGAELYGIGPPRRLIELFESRLRRVRWDVMPPFPIRHLDRLVLAESSEESGEDREALRRRIIREGYTRPSTLYVEGERGGPG
jgi:SAM-dependent methyltransferase